MSTFDAAQCKWMPRIHSHEAAAQNLGQSAMLLANYDLHVNVYYECKFPTGREGKKDAKEN